MILLNKLELIGWQEDEDLRKIGARATEIAKEFQLTPGRGVLVTNTRFGKYGERFRLICKDNKGRIWVLTPPKQDGLESLFVKMHGWLREEGW